MFWSVFEMIIREMYENIYKNIKFNVKENWVKMRLIKNVNIY